MANMVLAYQMKISVVIPAHNRPDFLMEAIKSLVAQTHSDWELVLVDDGSTIPLPIEQIKALLGSKGIFIRHEIPRGVAGAKNAGIRAATGEIITLLDDDDIFDDTAMEIISACYTRYPQLDCIFLGVRPFGAHASGPVSSRERAIKKLLENTIPRESDTLYFFGDSLFTVLLETVPIDFQRPAARKGTWNMVGGFIESGIFSESAWAIKASTMCTVALTKNALTCWRIHDNNFGWLSDASHIHATVRNLENGLKVRKALLSDFIQKKCTSSCQIKKIRASLSQDYFNTAYYLCGKNSSVGFLALVRSFGLQPRLKHCKLFVKYIVSVIGRKYI